MTFTGTQHTWNAPDGVSFSYSRWEAESAPKAIMVAVHGLSGAAVDYEPLGSRLKDSGVTTLAIELRGQGNDPLASRRGDLDQVEAWFTDLHAFLELVRREYPGTPLFYYGESMGAALLTRFLAQASSQDQPVGLILASPVVALPRGATRWQKLIFSLLLRVAPRFRINVRKLTKPKKDAEPLYVTRDEAHRSWFETAPHRLDRYTLRFFRCLHDLIEGCFPAAPRVEVPVLVLYAAHDVFILPARVEDFYALLGSEDKKRELFPEAYHLLLHDLDSEQVLNSIIGWLQPRLR